MIWPRSTGPVCDLGIECLGGHHTIHQALLQCRPGIDEIAGEQHLQRLFAPEVARQADPGSRAEQADVDPGSGKARTVDSNRQVAHRHQLTTGSSGDAMHARDHRLRHLRQGHHHPAATPEQILHEGLVVVGAHLLEIVTGTKCLAGTGDDHDAKRRVHRDGIELGLQGVDHCLRQGIELLRHD
jgi:hypothetical protein